MASLPWFRMYAEFMGDPVIQELSFEDQRHYAIILCMKCNGTLDRNIKGENRDRIIFRGLGLDQEKAEKVKEKLLESDLICKKWHPKGWEKRQFVSDQKRKSSGKSLNDNESDAAGNNILNVKTNHPETETDTEADTELDKDLKDSCDATAPRLFSDDFQEETKPPKKQTIPYQKIVDLYHELMPNNPEVLKLNEKRRRQIKNAWNDENGNDLESWKSYFVYCNESKFLTGRAATSPGRKVFIADLEWITNSTNMLKIEEGKYHL